METAIKLLKQGIRLKERIIKTTQEDIQYMINKVKENDEYNELIVDGNINIHELEKEIEESKTALEILEK